MLAALAEDLEEEFAGAVGDLGLGGEGGVGVDECADAKAAGEFVDRALDSFDGAQGVDYALAGGEFVAAVRSFGLRQLRYDFVEEVSLGLIPVRRRRSVLAWVVNRLAPTSDDLRRVRRLLHDWTLTDRAQAET